jgi:hypothetical protein
MGMLRPEAQRSAFIPKANAKPRNAPIEAHINVG